MATGERRCSTIGQFWPKIGHLADVSNVALRDRHAQPIRAPDHEGARFVTTLIADLAMSLDGFVADTNDNANELFGWYFGGDVEVPTPKPGFSFRAPEPSARVLREGISGLGALIGGRRYFDLADAWGGNHPMGVPTFIVTHSVPDGWPRADSNISFVTDGLDSAVEQAKAAAGDDKFVGVATPSIIQQLLNDGQLDAIHVNLVPVLLGAGVPFFANLADAPVRLSDPEVVESKGVTHLTYTVLK
jgi:dihydrofolate reductase